jgi:hypothetical protein
VIVDHKEKNSRREEDEVRKAVTAYPVLAGYL